MICKISNIKLLFRLASVCLLVLMSSSIRGQRQKTVLNRHWKFTPGYEVRKNVFSEITLPHTWNTKDALGGNINYYRGLGNYEHSLTVPEAWIDKRLFLRFLGVNTVANVFVNGKHVGEHKGGYTAFAFEITDFVEAGKENSIEVRVNNAPRLDVMPLVGDFNMYGGIYRDVELYVTEQNCISLLDYGSKGVYLHQREVSDDRAKVDAVIKLLGTDADAVRMRVFNRAGKEVLEKSVNLDDSRNEVLVPFTVTQPKLWNGQQNPYVYKVQVELLKKEAVVDRVVQPLGLRYWHVDPDKGLFLNGKHLQLRGVCRHQDRPEIGNALNAIHHAEDVSVMEEMGANAVRLSHYPQDPYMYELLDQKGFVVWSEIPFVGPGGYRDKGFVNQASFKENGKQQLIEMVRQQLNHPSILMWGLFNELKEAGDNPVDYIAELQELIKTEDPSRHTTAASNQGGDLNTITDLIAWNLYYGWYGGTPSGIGKWADNIHLKMPNTPVGISEYGAGAGLYHQQEELKKPKANSYWHPENWQTYFHEEHWKAIDRRPFLWGSFIWNMFDFGAAHRTEGEVDGKNDKGLVSFDRKVKKDAFYFYKANWNKETPMVYIADKRLSKRSSTRQTIKVYSNQKEVELIVNGVSQGKRAGSYCIFLFDVELPAGNNSIIAKAGKKSMDECAITIVQK